MKHIVCLGGGNAMPKSILKELKKYPVKISVICAMLDSGGSSGRLRKDYKISSPGDIRRSLLALANVSPIMEKLFNFRFKKGTLAGHNFANLFIAALELSTNSYKKTFDEMKRILNIQHEVLPATLSNSDLCARLSNGKIICGETNIDVPKHDPKLKIEKVFLKPAAKAYPPAIKIIKKADLILIGPGDLYSTIAQILLIKEISRAICQSRAKKVYICNLMTKRGETNDYSVLDFTRTIERFLGCELDFVLYNNFMPNQKRIKNYKKKHPELLDMVKTENCANVKFIGENFLLNQGAIEHDPKKLVKKILNII